MQTKVLGSVPEALQKDFLTGQGKLFGLVSMSFRISEQKHFSGGHGGGTDSVGRGRARSDVSVRTVYGDHSTRSFYAHHAAAMSMACVIGDAE
jgi:hypothetical protein